MSSPTLAGKIALITGGSKGIGAATAKALVGLGAKVVINYSSDVTAADALIIQLGAKNAFAVKADAGTICGIESTVNAAVSTYGKIDILIPNAGILPMKDIQSTTEADFDLAFGLNIKGPYFLVQKALPHMANGSSIILLSTSLNYASTVQGPYTLYCATKGAIDQIVRLLSKDLLAKKGINVNAIAPGPTGTELFFKGKNEMVLNHIAAMSPKNKIGTPEEIAEAMVFLSSRASSWVSGQTIRVNGGMV